MPDNPATLRTFIALPLPAEWTEALATTIADLRRTIPAGVRWVNSSGIHLTLKFLGATDAAIAPRIVSELSAQLAGAAPPTLSLSDLGRFPSRGNPRVIWAGVSHDSDGLDDLFRRVESTATALGWPREKRPFRPHLTLGRVREQATAAQRRAIADAIAAVSLTPAPAWPVATVRLYRSQLTPQGAIYSSLGEVKI